MFDFDPWFHGVMVITSDFDSDDLSSILSGTFYYKHLNCFKLFQIHFS